VKFCRPRVESTTEVTIITENVANEDMRLCQLIQKLRLSVCLCVSLLLSLRELLSDIRLTSSSAGDMTS